MLSYNKYNVDILKLELKVQGKTVSFEQNLSTCSLGLVFSCKLTQTETLVDQKVADIRFAPSSAWSDHFKALKGIDDGCTFQTTERADKFIPFRNFFKFLSLCSGLPYQH